MSGAPIITRDGFNIAAMVTRDIEVSTSVSRSEEIRDDGPTKEITVSRDVIRYGIGLVLCDLVDWIAEVQCLPQII